MPRPLHSLHDETHLKVLRLLQASPAINQRALAQALGVSLGKANYCLNALVAKGLLKVNNFKNNNNKLSYAYLLTPKGFTEKAALTKRFLQRKTQEYDLLKAEIDLLSQEVDAASTGLSSARAPRRAQVTNSP